MSGPRNTAFALTAALLALTANAPAQADGVMLHWRTLPPFPDAKGDADRPIVIGQVPDPATPKRDDRVWDWSKSQELHDLPAPPPNLAGAPTTPERRHGARQGSGKDQTVDLPYVAGHGSPSSSGKIRTTPRWGTRLH